MNENVYTHIPIYDGKKMVGIFSEDCAFQYIYNNEIISIDDSMKFKIDNLRETLNRNGEQSWI